MINLLPPETKRQIRAGRMNVVLYKYCMLIIATALLLAGVFGAGFWTDLQERQLAENLKRETESANVSYATTRNQAEDFAKDLRSAKTILASNVSFSKLVFDIAAHIPSGVVLNTLSLNTTAKADTPIDINARAASYNAAISLKNSLEDSPTFEQVNIVNVSQTDTSDQSSDTTRRYPFIVALKAKRTVAK